MLRIADLDFKTESVILDAYVDENNMTLKWGLEIKAKTGEGEYSRWAPKASIETFRETKSTDLNHWLDLAGTQVVWNEPYDSNGESYATLYVFEHEPIYNSRIDISRNGNSLYLKWIGKSNVNWNSKYGHSLNINIEAELFFKGIWFGKKPEFQSRSLLSKFFNPNLFKFVQTEHGVSLFRPNAI